MFPRQLIESNQHALDSTVYRIERHADTFAKSAHNKFV